MNARPAMGPAVDRYGIDEVTLVAHPAAMAQHDTASTHPLYQIHRITRLRRANSRWIASVIPVQYGHGRG